MVQVRLQFSLFLNFFVLFFYSSVQFNVLIVYRFIFSFISLLIFLLLRNFFGELFTVWFFFGRVFDESSKFVPFFMFHKYAHQYCQFM